MTGEAKRVLVYRGGSDNTRAIEVKNLIVSWGYDENLITIVHEWQSAISELYGANRTKDALLSLTGPLSSPSDYWMVIAGAGRNVNFLTDHVIRVCGISFGVVSADLGSINSLLNTHAEFILSANDISVPQRTATAQQAFWRAMNQSPRYKVPSWRKRKDSIRHDNEWQI